MKILDCTLRDGGYYTNWDFSDEIVEIYLKAVEVLPIDIIEVGYRSTPQKGYFGRYFYCPIDTLKKVRELAPSKEIAIMLNEKDVTKENAKNLLKDLNEYVDLVRLAVNPARFKEALELAQEVKNLGFKVAFNLMYMSKMLGNMDMLSNLSQANGVVDYFNLVDSFGGVYPADVKEVTLNVKPNLNMPLGFHGHNNLELAFINSITAIENGCEIVDGTITGMGRGAGNLKMELFLTWLSTARNIDVDFNALSEVVAAFEKLQENYDWGTKLPYMVSGVSSLPQKDVMDWVSKRYYSMNSIIRALHVQKKGLEQDRKFPNLQNMQFSNVLIIGGGNSVIENCESIKQWINNNSKDLVVIHSSSRNAQPFENLDVQQIYCLVGNEGHRLESTFESLNTLKGICMLPPSPRKMGTYIPESMLEKSNELSSVDFTDRYQDTHTAIALQTAINLQADNVFVVGYDGYSNVKIGEKEKDLLYENNYLFNQFQSREKTIRSLTKTIYDTLIHDSVYSYLT